MIIMIVLTRSSQSFQTGGQPVSSVLRNGRGRTKYHACVVGGVGAAWWFYKIMMVRIMIIYYQHDHRDHNNNLCHNHYLVQSTRTGWKRTMFCAQMGVAGRAPTKHQNSKTKTLSLGLEIISFDKYTIYNIQYIQYLIQCERCGIMD